MNPRVSWAELPAGVRRRIETEAGPFIRGEQVAAGHNCLAALIVHTTAGSWFVKGIRADHARAVWHQSNEAAINPYVAAVTAPLEFRIQADGWDVLGFRYLAGHRHASLVPGSPDLALVAATLQALAALPAPGDVPLRTIEARWHSYIGDRAALLAGPVIAHTDLHRHNILIGPAGAKLVDWAWPTLAAPWVDTACAGLQLIAAGHHPAAAQEGASRRPLTAQRTMRRRTHSWKRRGQCGMRLPSATRSLGSSALPPPPGAGHGTARFLPPVATELSICWAAVRARHPCRQRDTMGRNAQGNNVSNPEKHQAGGTLARYGCAARDLNPEPAD